MPSNKACLLAFLQLSLLFTSSIAAAPPQRKQQQDPITSGDKAIYKQLRSGAEPHARSLDVATAAVGEPVAAAALGDPVALDETPNDDGTRHLIDGYMPLDPLSLGEPVEIPDWDSLDEEGKRRLSDTLYFIRPESTDNCLDYNFSTKQVYVWSGGCHGGTNQQWYITSGREWKTMYSSTLCMDNKDGSLPMQSCVGTKRQKFGIVRTDSTSPSYFVYGDNYPYYSTTPKVMDYNGVPSASDVYMNSDVHKQANQRWRFYLASGPAPTPTPPSPTPSPPSSGCASGSICSEMLSVHNQARSELNKGIPNLVWSTSKASSAQSWANTLAANSCGLTHSGGNYGENLYMSGGSSTPRQAANAWYAEKSSYVYTTCCPNNSVTGHYTQMIWKNTSSVGCATARGSNGCSVWVCQYDPAGNYLGQYPY